MPLTSEELEPLLRLALVRGVGPLRLARLVEWFGSAERVINARPIEVRQVEGIGAELARRLGEAGSSAGTREVRIALRVLARLNAVAVTRHDPLFPESIRRLPDPPYLLFCIGDAGALTRQSVAVVGTRDPTVYGRRTARGLSEQLAGTGLAIVSGMARGIDAEAHRGALLANGLTIGVLGHGIDRVYPPECRDLFLTVRDRGILLTEYAPGETPRAGNFPRRNRLITALSDAVLVVEMGLRSGAQHTVNYALDQGKEVLAVPGPVGVPTCEGTNRLLQDGAALITSASDVIEIIHGVGAGRSLAPKRVDSLRDARARRVRDDIPHDGAMLPLLNASETKLMRVLSAHPEHIDQVAAAAGLDVRETLVTLLELELRGLATALPGKRFILA